MIYFEADGGRICIVSNFMGHILLGSTDIPVDDPDSVICQDDEVSYLLDAFNKIFPKVDVSHDDIFFSYAGIRPLPASDASDPGGISRDHSVDVIEPEGKRSFPILSLVGGKWTTFRAFSADVTDMVLERLGIERPISTEDLAIGGGASLTPVATSTETLVRDIARNTALSRGRANELVFRYGARARDLARALEGRERRLVQVPEF